MLKLKWTEEIKQTLQIPKKIKRNHQTSKSNGHCASLLIHSYMGIHPHMIQKPPKFKNTSASRMWNSVSSFLVHSDPIPRCRVFDACLSTSITKSYAMPTASPLLSSCTLAWSKSSLDLAPSCRSTCPYSHHLQFDCLHLPLRLGKVILHHCLAKA